MPKTIEWGNPYTHETHSRASFSSDDLATNNVPSFYFGKEKTCEWCGNLNRTGGLFEYNNSGKLFCSKGCHRSYFTI